MALSTKSTMKAIIGVGVLCALVVLGYEVFYWFTHVYAGGARIQTELTKMSSRVDGTIATLHVKEGEKVEEGQLLISLVDDDIRLRSRALETDVSLERARRERLTAERQAFEIELTSKLATKRASMRAIEIKHRALKGPACTGGKGSGAGQSFIQQRTYRGAGVSS